jgi:hypothetical protein
MCCMPSSRNRVAHSLVLLATLALLVGGATPALAQTTYNDGSANAPAGTAQLPNFFSGYSVRPPWKVAGVDYYVGIPQGTILKDPLAVGALPPCANTDDYTQ